MRLVHPLILTMTMTLTGCPAYNTCERDDPENIAECCRQCAENPTVDDCVPVCAGSCDCSGTDAGDGGADAGDTGVPDTGPDTAVPDAGPCGMTCPVATPLCDATSGACVECLGTGDCSAPTALCDTTSNMCVACLADGDCTDPTMARCDAGACVPCTEAGQCVGIAGLGLCETGDCVECTIADASACGVSPCTVANVCSAFGAMARDTCESCDTDTNCMASFCVPMDFMGVARTSAYCLQDNSGGCTEPFTTTISGRTTQSGITGRIFCGIAEVSTTCEAVLALPDNTMCPGGSDAECPEGGLCRTLDPGGAMLANRCTYECSTAFDCPVGLGPASSCGDGGTGGVDYCGG